MKKIFSLLTLAIFCLTTPLISEESTSNENESPHDLTSPDSATEDAPLRADARLRVRDRTDDIVPTSDQKYRKATIAAIGTLAAITLGLIVSGANTGKRTHIPKKS